MNVFFIHLKIHLSQENLLKLTENVKVLCSTWPDYESGNLMRTVTFSCSDIIN